MTDSGRVTAGHQRGLRETMGGEVEALRTWLLGGIRISVGPSRSIGDEDWHLRKAGNLVKLPPRADGGVAGPGLDYHSVDAQGRQVIAVLLGVVREGTARIEAGAPSSGT